MKYLKLFEEIEKDDLQIGDFIIANFLYDNDIVWQNYINNNIGEFIGKINIEKEIRHGVRYFIDDKIYNEAFYNSEDDRFIYIINNEKYITMKFERKTIRKAALEEIEQYKTEKILNKYNI